MFPQFCFCLQDFIKIVRQLLATKSINGLKVGSLLIIVIRSTAIYTLTLMLLEANFANTK